MRVLIAPDKFKGTLTARQAAEAIARGWQQARPADQLTLLPISDGGDGFGAVMGEQLQARPQKIRTVNAAHRPISATWWWQPETRTAVIESANVIGLAMLSSGKSHPFQLDTFGLGAVVAAARKKGARHLIIGIGGSATNDGGFGLAQALGWRFLDRSGDEITSWTNLSALQKIQPASRFPKGFITVAVDVKNPLLGRHGATRIYGPQKGIRPQDVAPAESCLQRLATVLKQQFRLHFAPRPGAGAAGGLGCGLASFTNATLVSGFDLFARQAGLNQALARADLLITAEGALDRSTLMGKGAGQIATQARRQKIPIIGLAGVIHDKSQLQKLFTKTHALVELTTTTEARRRARFWLTRLAFHAATNMPS